MTEQVLASHSQVHGGGELRLVPDLFESLPRIMGVGAPAAVCLGRLDGATIGGLARELDHQLQALAPRALRVVDKMPENYLYLGLLAALFPRARFIHCPATPWDAGGTTGRRSGRCWPSWARTQLSHRPRRIRIWAAAHCRPSPLLPVAPRKWL